jgi:hypothetical protein
MNASQKSLLVCCTALLLAAWLPESARAQSHWQGPPPASGVRVTAGVGIGGPGPGVRAGFDSSFWLLPWLSVGGRALYGYDGLLNPEEGRHLVQAAPEVLFRLASGPGGSFMAGAGAGYAWMYSRIPCNSRICPDEAVFQSSHTSVASIAVGTVMAPRRTPALAFSALFRLELLGSRSLVPTFSVGLGPRIWLANEI